MISYDILRHLGFLPKALINVMSTSTNQVLCIIPKALKLLGFLPNPPTGEELVVLSMQKRKLKMLNHVDAFIFLPRDLITLKALITFAF